jgi:CRISPR-associated protein Cas1
MPTACILHSHARVGLVSERLEVRGRRDDPEAGPGEDLLREIPLRDLDRLVIAESVQVTSQALAALLRADIPVNLLGWSGQFLGGFLPATNAHGLARLRQYQRTLDPAFALQIAGRLVTAKLYNQRRVLQRLEAYRAATRTPPAPPAPPAPSAPPAPPAPPAPSAPPAPPAPSAPSAPPAPPAPSTPSATHTTLAWLDTLFTPISRATSLDELRGYEGAATARYFQTWATFLPAEFPFERRSTRPPLNPVNACISFGATLLYSEAVAFLHAHGLDPALGLLHATENGRWSLALDLIEPFRPVLVEALALDCFSHQILNTRCFDPKNGGIYLNDTGRRKYLLQYERRLERQFMSEAVGHRTTLRQQLEQHAIQYKAALDDPTKFEPFLIN